MTTSRKFKMNIDLINFKVKDLIAKIENNLSYPRKNDKGELTFWNKVDFMADIVEDEAIKRLRDMEKTTGEYSVFLKGFAAQKLREDKEWFEKYIAEVKLVELYNYLRSWQTKAENPDLW